MILLLARFVIKYCYFQSDLSDDKFKVKIEIAFSNPNTVKEFSAEEEIDKLGLNDDTYSSIMSRLATALVVKIVQGQPDEE